MFLSVWKINPDSPALADKMNRRARRRGSPLIRYARSAIALGLLVLNSCLGRAELNNPTDVNAGPFAFLLIELAAGNNKTTELFVRSGLYAWFSADETAGGASGDLIGLWGDLSGNGRDAIQNNPGQEPTLQNNGPNNRPYLLFDGTNDYLDLSAVQLNPGNSSLTILLVLRFATPASPQAVIMQRRGAGQESIFLYYNFPPICPSEFLAASFGGQDICTYSSHPVGAWTVFSVRYDGTTYEIHRNGTLFGAAGGTTSGSIGGWLIGAHENFTLGWLDGGIAELLVYERALPDSERKQAECYLSEKYAIQFQDGCG